LGGEDGEWSLVLENFSERLIGAISSGVVSARANWRQGHVTLVSIDLMIVDRELGNRENPG